MFRPFKKFLALILAIWLPLFSGNALAMHIAMQNDNQSAAMQQASHQSHQHQMDVNQEQSTSHHEGKDSGCNNCSVCHLACCGYMNTAAITMAEIQLSSVAHPSLSPVFQSFASAPLDPPPLARV
ncbi:MAG: DUF2946 domain-containing protein [Gallionellaceae bacterium]|nr:DUF2946 domain-containing protein [Gallionellaceae bacterium]